MINYIIEVSICWLGFYALYHLLLRGETFFNVNRLYLLSTLAMGLLIPLLELPSIIETSPGGIASYYLEPIVVGVQQMEYSIEDIVITPVMESSTMSIQSLLSILYWLGFAFFLSRFLIGIGQIGQLYLKGTKHKEGKYTYVKTSSYHLPFSFFNCLFWSNEFEAESTDEEKIRLHELAHIKGWHSYDIILLEILKILLWCTPLIYLYKKEIQNVHEYLADDAVLQSTAKKQYGRLLIRHAQSGMQLALANHFIHSQLKNRILMMTKHKSNRKALSKYLLALPILVCMILVLSNKEVRASLNYPDSDAIINPYDLENNSILVTQTEFDEEKVREQLAHKLSQYDPEADKESRRAAFSSFFMTYFALKTSHPDHVDRIKEISRELFKKYKAPFEFRDGDDLYHMIDQQITETSSSEVFKVVEEMPRFPGCEDQTDRVSRDNCSKQKMLEHIYKNIRYPAEARKAGVEGIIVIKFIVDKTGNILSPKAIRTIGGGCDEEALRVVNSMPTWTPGKQRGKTVNVEFNLPIKFKLEGDSKKDEPKIDLSFAGDEKPLIIVDDVITTQIKDLDPDDIATIDVLKGDAAFEKYGDKAKNGVVIIRTKTAETNLERIHVVGHKPEVAKSDKNLNDVARFPGCEDIKDAKEKDNCSKKNLLTFIYSNLKYPKAAAKEGVQGTVVVKFLIDNEGNITEREIMRGIGSGCDEAVLKVVDMMEDMDERWIPAVDENGKAVSSYFTLPVKFKLAEGDTKKEITLAKPLQNSLKLESLNIYPNPSNGLMNLDFKGPKGSIELQVTDVSGKVIYSEQLDQFDGIYNKQLDLRKAPKGNIILSIIQNGKVYNEKILLQE